MLFSSFIMFMCQSVNFSDAVSFLDCTKLNMLLVGCNRKYDLCR